jgi:hypothetical protein
LVPNLRSHSSLTAGGATRSLRLGLTTGGARGRVRGLCRRAAR